MPRKQKRERVERGLYRSGKTYIAIATAPGERRPRERSLGEVGLLRARDLRDDFRRELREGRAPASGADARATFSDIADEWLLRQQQLVDVGELASRTFDAYESATRLHLKPHFGSRRARAISADDLVGWHAAQRAGGAAAWSIKGRWTALRGILGHAARRRVIETNPCDLLERRERPHAGESRKRFLTDDEMRRLLGAAPSRWRPLVAVCLFAGLRISEALALQWHEVDFDNGVIRVRHQLGRNGKRVRIKTPAARRDPILMATLATVLRTAKMAARHSRDRDFVFATSTGTAVSARNATRAFEKAVDEADVEGVTNHTLRHTFASMLIAQGHDPVFVADQLGHTDPAVTLRVYAHLFRAAKQAREARDQMDAEFGHLLRGTDA